MLKTGPDGALWIADMYRAVIEHPEWIPDDWEKRLDLRAGSEQGRIYRVYPGRQEAAADPAARPARYGRAGRRARQPQRLAARHGPAAALAPARPGRDRAASQARARRPSGPRRASRRSGRWPISAASTSRRRWPASTDPDPRVRESVIAAVRAAAEPIVQRWPRPCSGWPTIPMPRVRFQVALALGNWDDQRAGEALARLARRDGNDPWMRAAILSSAVPHVDDAAGRAAADGGGRATPPPAAMVEPLLALAGSLPDRRPIEAVDRDRSASRRGRGVATPPGSSPRSPGLLEARDRAEAAAGARSRQAVRSGLAGRSPGWSRDDKAAEAERLAAVAAAGSRRRAQHRGSRPAARAAPAAGLVGLQQAAVAALGTDDRPQARRLAGARLEEALAAGPRRDPRHAAEPDGVDVVAALVARRRLRAAGRDRPGPAAAASRRGAIRRSEARAEAVFAHQAEPRQAVVDSFRSALGIEGRSRRRRGRLQEAVRLVPSPGQRRGRGRPRPRHA